MSWPERPRLLQTVCGTSADVLQSVRRRSAIHFTNLNVLDLNENRDLPMLSSEIAAWKTHSADRRMSGRTGASSVPECVEQDKKEHSSGIRFLMSERIHPARREQIATCSINTPYYPSPRTRTLKKEESILFDPRIVARR
jgi:hypothetical protein